MTRPTPPSSTSTPRKTRRWPDLLIGALVLLLLGGFGSLLLGNRTPTTTTVQKDPAIPAAPGIPEPVGGTDTGATTPVPDPAPVAVAPDPAPVKPIPVNPEPAQPTTPEPATPVTTEPAPTTSEPTPSEPEPATTQPTPPQATPSQPTPTPAPPTPATPAPTAPAARPDTVQAAPIRPAPQAQPPVPEVPSASTLNRERPGNVDSPAATPAQQTPATQTPATQTPATPPQETAPAVTTAAPRAGGAVATSAQRTPLRSDYRISLGSFSTARTVSTQTAGVRGLGYTVYPIDLGDSYVAQVGPFADEAAAQQALADIQRVYPGALLYRPRNAAASTTTPATTPAPAPAQAATPAAPPAPAPTAPAPAPAPVTANTPTYLQVGAFDRMESAQNLVQQLRDLGYDPNVNAPEGRKVTVSVGPYTGDALTRTEARLDENGLDHFRVR